MPSLRGWNSRSRWHERLPGRVHASTRRRPALCRPFRALAHRPPACRLAGGGAGRLAGRALRARWPRRDLAGAHRGCGHAPLPARRGGDDPAATGGLRPRAGRGGMVAVGAPRAVCRTAGAADACGARLPLCLHPGGHRARPSAEPWDPRSPFGTALPGHLPRRTGWAATAVLAIPNNGIPETICTAGGRRRRTGMPCDRCRWRDLDRPAPGGAPAGRGGSGGRFRAAPGRRTLGLPPQWWWTMPTRG